MREIFGIFSIRESALILWVSILAVFFISKKEVRTSIGNLIRSLLNIQLFSILVIFNLCILGIIWILFNLSLWETLLIKDTIYWYFSVAIIMLMNSNNITGHKYFKDVALASIRWIVFLEFLINFATFNLIVELILMPILIITVATQAFAEVYSEKDEKYRLTNKFLKNVLSIIGLIFICYSFYKTFTNFSQLATIINLKSFLLPILLTIFISPFIYLLSVYMNYESLFSRIKFMVNDDRIIKQSKKAILKTSKLNLSKIKRINKNLYKLDLLRTTNLDTLFRNISNQKPAANEPAASMRGL